MLRYSLSDLQKQFTQKEKLKYVFFWGHSEKGNELTKACFSQWYKSPFEHKGIVYRTAEHYMMAEKARLFKCDHLIQEIIDARDPGKAKALGRQVTGFKQEIWDEERYRIVLEGNQFKFEQNLHLKEFLINTKKRVLVEASPVDKIWGIGMAQDNEHIDNPYKWKGHNFLGFALMQVRDGLSV